jgi:hypothetical protein
MSRATPQTVCAVLVSDDVAVCHFLFLKRKYFIPVGLIVVVISRQVAVCRRDLLLCITTVSSTIYSEHWVLFQISAGPSAQPAGWLQLISRLYTVTQVRYIIFWRRSKSPASNFLFFVDLFLRRKNFISIQFLFHWATKRLKKGLDICGVYICNHLLLIHQPPVVQLYEFLIYIKS